MLLFKKDNRLRVFLNIIIEHKYFEDFIYHLIAMNSILLLINYPTITDVYFNRTIDMIVDIISACFIFEAILKITALGFYFGEGAYLKDSWNILDFVIVLSSVLNWVLDAVSGVNFSFLRGFRALRALRPLRMISKDEGMKTVVNSLLRAIPNLFNVALINMLFFVVFGILGVQIFKGQLGHCSDSSINEKANCEGVDATNTEREWIVPFNNFDNIVWSIITFFELATLEGWPSTLLRIIDSQGTD